MTWVLRGLRNGIVTSRYPRRPDPHAEVFPASVQPVANAPADETLCPTRAIHSRVGVLRVDAGQCILCGRCVRERPDLFGWVPGSQTARLHRQALVVPQLPETDEAVELLRRALAARVRMFRRSVHIRHVDAGSDGSDGMAEPLHRTVEATPRPLVVIAAGTDAVSGGLIAPSYAVAGGIGELVDVDVWVPGSPPSPLSLLPALLLAVGRIQP